jgi:Ran GTPase-activating protein (RanGAP) involved in mRNA processing and transport
MVLVEGQLRSKVLRDGVLGDTWRPRHFVFDTATRNLCLYEEGGGAGRRRLEVEDEVVAGVGSRDELQGARWHKAHRFDFVLESGSTICVSAPSAADRLRWIGAVAAALSERDATIAGLRADIAAKCRQLEEQGRLLEERDRQLEEKDRQLAVLGKMSVAAKAAKEECFNDGLGPVLKNWIQRETPSQGAAIKALKAQLDSAQQEGLHAWAVLLAPARRAMRDAVEPLVAADALPRLRQIVDDGNELYDGMYDSIIKKVRNNNGYDDFCRELEAVELARARFPQRASDVVEIFETAVAALPLFTAVLEVIQRQIQCEARPAPLKKVFRVLQKHATRIDGDPHDCQRACDIVRGSIVCTSMDGLLQVLHVLIAMHCSGSIAIARVKNRFANPTSAGWADAMLNFVVNGSDHVCELQLIHSEMLKARKEFGGHQAYAATREAAEVLEFAVMTLLGRMGGGGEGGGGGGGGGGGADAPIAQMCAVLGAAPVGCDAREMGHAIVRGASLRKGLPATVGGLSLAQLLDEQQLVFGDIAEGACAAIGAFVSNNLQLRKIIFPSGAEMEASVAVVDLASKSLGIAGAALLAAFLPLCAALTDLDLEGNGIGHEGATLIASVLPSTPLVTLNLCDNEIGAQGAMALAKALPSASVESINLLQNGVSGGAADVVRAAEQRSTLRTLCGLGAEQEAADLSGRSLDASDSALLACDLRASTSLKSLTASRNAIGDEGAKLLAAALPSGALETLVLVDTKIGGEGAKALAEALPNTRLTSFDVSYNEIRDEGLKFITEVLPRCALSKLYAYYNKIGAVGAKLLAEALPRSSLKSMNLLQNDMGEATAGMIRAADGKIRTFCGIKPDQEEADFSYWALKASDAALIAYDLKANPQVSSLNLYYNAIGDEGLKCLAAALPSSAVKNLELFGNSIGDEGIQCLSEVLPSTSLETLNLQDNAIGKDGAKFLACVLPSTALVTLNLGNNEIGAEGATLIADVLDRVSLLTSLDVTSNFLDASSIELVRTTCATKEITLLL